MDMKLSMTRRTALVGLGMAGVAVGLPAVVWAVDNLKPGEFVWNPDASPTGPVAIIVSLPEQRCYVYRNGIEIGVSTCSTGKPGHETPTGVFTILQKDKNHHSSTYNNAPMPNMERLTWQGIALHAGNLPGYPASHGCVRLPMDFSAKLFGVTHMGTPVIIADASSAPASIVHPGQVLSADAAAEMAHVIDTKAQTPHSATPVARVASNSVPTPRLSPHDKVDTPAPVETAATEPPPVPATAILVSGADQRIMVLDNGRIVAEGTATIADPGDPLGNHVFVLSGVNDADGQLHWHSFSHASGVGADVDAADLATIQRIRGTPEVIEAIRTRMHPGTLMVTVDAPVGEDTQTADNFVVMSTEAG